MKIGIFDSGMGGLTVLHEAYHLLDDDVNYMFYADLEHVPYGMKSADQILGYADEIVRFMIARGAGAIVIACNTATAVAVAELRKKYTDIPIIGMEPAVKPAVETTAARSRIMVIATPVTIREKKLSHLLERVDGDHRVDLLATPHLVTFAENEQFDDPEVEEYLREQFASFDMSVYKALVLGCTHFNYFKPMYRKILGDSIQIIDGNAGTIRHLADVCGIRLGTDANRSVTFTDTDQMLAEGNTQYFVSGREVSDVGTLNHVLRLHNRLEAVRSL